MNDANFVTILVFDVNPKKFFAIIIVSGNIVTNA